MSSPNPTAFYFSQAELTADQLLAKRAMPYLSSGQAALLPDSCVRLRIALLKRRFINPLRKNSSNDVLAAAHDFARVYDLDSAQLGQLLNNTALPGLRLWLEALCQSDAAAKTFEQEASYRRKSQGKRPPPPVPTRESLCAAVIPGLPKLPKSMGGRSWA